MNRKSNWVQLLTALTLLIFFSSGSSAKDEDAPSPKPQSAALVVNGKRLLTFYTELDGLTPEERVQRASIVLRQLASTENFPVDSIHALEGLNGTEIIAGNQRIATITVGDAEYAKGNTKLVANDFILKAKIALIKRSVQTDGSSFAVGMAFCIIGFLVFVLASALISRAAIYLCEASRKVRESKQSGIKIQNAELISADTMLDLITALTKFAQLLLIFSLGIAYILLSLSFFPNTKPFADALVASAAAPIASVQDSIWEYLPKLFILIIIGLLTYGNMFIAKFFFNALRDGSIRLADFDPDWALPTYKLARFIICFFALVCALPYLPGWDTPAFKQLGLVVGVLISFGSSTAIGNMMAGVVLTYTNAFRLGDRVKVAENIGDVIDKTLFVTKLRTPKGEIISIPNAPILSGTIVNYSAEGKQGKLILHTTVTIGYDVPWRKVHEALLAAAAETEFVLKDPAPFVLQSSLDDFYVKYEINVFTDQPLKMLDIYSKVHANIQDQFFNAGLEIMSPHYTSIRDGNRPAIPAQYLPQDYVENSFKVSSAK